MSQFITRSRETRLNGSELMLFYFYSQTPLERIVLESHDTKPNQFHSMANESRIRSSESRSEINECGSAHTTDSRRKLISCVIEATKLLSAEWFAFDASQSTADRSRCGERTKRRKREYELRIVLCVDYGCGPKINTLTASGCGCRSSELLLAINFRMLCAPTTVRQSSTRIYVFMSLTREIVRQSNFIKLLLLMQKQKQ